MVPSDQNELSEESEEFNSVHSDDRLVSSNESTTSVKSFQFRAIMRKNLSLQVE